MKALKVLAGMFFLLIMCCCGIGALFGPSPSTPLPSQAVLPRQPKTSSTPAPQKSEEESVVDRLFKERSTEYDLQLADWKAAKAASDEAQSELSVTQSEIDGHQIRKPEQPIHAEREWSAVNKKFTTNATLISTDDVTAKLKKRSGKEIEVPKDKLISADRIYISNAFNDSSAYEDAMEEWNATSDDLNIRLSAITKRIESGTKPSPSPPDRSKIRAELAAAEATRKRVAKLAKAEAEEKVKAESQKRAQDEIDAYATILRIADPEGTLVTEVRSNGDKLTLTVSNAWHFQPYQIRFQAAQNLWQGWANLHSRSNVDKARLSLVDLNGNEVGGSRVWGGSLIWVKKN